MDTEEQSGQARSRFQITLIDSGVSTNLRRMQEITEIEMIDVYLSELCEQPATPEISNKIDQALDARNRWGNTEQDQSISLRSMPAHTWMCQD